MKRTFCIALLWIMAAASSAFAQQDILKNSSGYTLTFLMVDNSDHITGKTGLSPTVTISKAGGSFATPSGSVSEIANGWYKVAGNTSDTNTDGEILLHATASGADPTDAKVGVVVDYDPRGVPTLSDMVTAMKAITVQKNLAFANYPIWMLSSNGTAQTGLSTSQISCQISKDNGSWAPLTDTTETEIGLGKYVVDLTAAETNANSLSIVCTGPGGTQPYRTNITPQH